MKQFNPEKMISLRKKKKFSQLDLSYHCGISLPTVKNIENGINTPGGKILAKLSNVLKVKIDNLFIEEEK